MFAEIDQPGKDRGWVEGARGEIVAELVPIVAQVTNLGISYILIICEYNHILVLYCFVLLLSLPICDERQCQSHTICFLIYPI